MTLREGDYFDPLVNLVARLVKAAPPGALVVTDKEPAALPADRWTLRALGSPPLRGLKTVPVFSVMPVGSPTDLLTADCERSTSIVEDQTEGIALAGTHDGHAMADRGGGPARRRPNRRVAHEA